jgi:cysteine synthase A
MNNRHNNILSTIGNTPIVKLNKLSPEGVNIFVKLEYFNPMGSVKDRLALGVVEDAEKRGVLKPGQTIVEATSGNTGIGLAMVCAQKGYPLVIVMSESFSVERRKMMRFLGAKVILTPASEKGTGMMKKAMELANEHDWWCPKQFENPANADIHAKTTAIEILRDFEDISLDYWVSGFGTGGTLNGVSRVLKQKSPNTKIMVCEPDNSPILASEVPQPKDQHGNLHASHPTFRPHLMQGWTPDFIPGLVEQDSVKDNIDGFVPIDGNHALQCSRDLATKEGIFVGITAGATLSGALELAKSCSQGSNILCMLPDTGERYLTTPLFEDIQEDMSEQELSISKSTQGYRFDIPSNTPAAIETRSPIVLDKAAKLLVNQFLTNNDQPVVMFALEWCEFCWSVRKMFKKLGIDYVSVDIDSAKYQKNNMGGKIRQVIRDKTTWNTFPQIFIGGEFVGGCTDVFDLYKAGDLTEKLSKASINVDSTVSVDPYTFLPKWLHAR